MSNPKRPIMKWIVAEAILAERRASGKCLSKARPKVKPTKARAA